MTYAGAAQIFDTLLHTVHTLEGNPGQHGRMLALQARLQPEPAAAAFSSAARLLQSTLPEQGGTRAPAMAEAGTSFAQAALLTAQCIISEPSKQEEDSTVEQDDGSRWAAVAQDSLHALGLWEAALQDESAPLASWAAWGHDLGWAARVAQELGFMLALALSHMDALSRICNVVSALGGSSASTEWTNPQQYSTAALLYPQGRSASTCSDGRPLMAESCRAEAHALAKAHRKGTPGSLQRAWQHTEAAVLAIGSGWTLPAAMATDIGQMSPCEALCQYAMMCRLHDAAF